MHLQILYIAVNCMQWKTSKIQYSGHSLSQYGPPGREITYMYYNSNISDYQVNQ